MPQSEIAHQTRDLSRRLLVALFTPMLLLLAMAVILWLQLARMNDDAQWVDHTDEVLSVLANLQSDIIDQENSLRGFLLSGDHRFLEPYHKANPPHLIARLRVLVADNPPQVDRMDLIRQRYDSWLAIVRDIPQNGRQPESLTLDALLARKAAMDGVRETILAAVQMERDLHRIRTATSAASARMSRNLFIGLFIAAAAVLAFLSRRQLSGIAATYKGMLTAEREARTSIEIESWLRAGQAHIAEQTQGDLTVEQLGEQVLRAVAKYVQADVGVFFTSDDKGWRRRAGFALDGRTAGAETFGLGEGLVGRAGAQNDPIHLKDVPADYLVVRSGTGGHTPVEVVLVPARSEKVTHAVVELGFLHPVEPRALDLLRRVGETLAIAVRSTMYKERLRDLLEESQRQGEELQTQQEELRVSNEELAEQTNALREANAQSEERQEELEQTNARLEEQTSALQIAQRAVTEKAAEAERATRYKSEFLANMSHELRTPLNSALILSKLLAANKDGNLTAEQVRFADTIHSAGQDLLALINDILDLSKIEAGMAEIRPATMHLSRLRSTLLAIFEPVARERHLTLNVVLEPGVPETIETDAKWLEQILRNLLSNAMKFTHQGEVSLRVTSAGDNVRFAVKDSGIGIAKHQHELIFEAFRQADGTTNRKYGGTGLGLSISRDLTRLLGGTLTLESEEGRGSTFTLTVPRTVTTSAEGASSAGPGPMARSSALAASAAVASAPAASPAAAPQAPTPPAFADDRDHLDRRRRFVLIIEDDVAFAHILSDLAHEMGFQCIVAHDATTGLALAVEHVPSAIVLDINLPDHSGLSVLDRVKRNPTIRHIPVHVVTAADVGKEARQMGAVNFIGKPAQREDLAGMFHKIEERLARRVRRLLIVEDDEVQRESLAKLLGGADVEITAVGSVPAALAALGSVSFDCVVTDLKLPGASGFELLEKMAQDDSYAFPPVIVYTGRMLTKDEEQRLLKYSSSIIVKGARSPERLIDEVTLFLHQVEADLPVERQRILSKARDREGVFEGRQILVVEDDVRNIFALSSLLEPRGAKVVIARNGREGLEALEKNPGVSLVLMDIMMPEMDGLQATREIRKQPKWAKLPIIALTAKAMPDDQERCRQAGANDYIAKPLDAETLLSLIRIWLPK